MSNRSPARGITDISDVFLSGKKKTDAASPAPSFEADTRCDTCVHFFSTSDKPTCRIFTFDYVQYGVPHVAAIDPAGASSCRYYASRQGKQAPDGLSAADGVEIEDTLVLTRKIAVRNDSLTQKSFRRIIFDHLEQGYDIKRIVMEKHSGKDARDAQNIAHTKVDVFVEEDEN